ncbi:hypothetical protein K458DRAFT_276177, partial [Lentithecium fluviatile CBS 122367]
KKTTDRIVKRPKRGFHTFKNGALNVRPKGTEVAMYTTRNIWAEVLGGKTFRQHPILRPRLPALYKLKAPKCDRRGCMALLRTCRQIYAETSLIPYQSGIFSATDLFHFRPLLKKLKVNQRSQIATLQLEIRNNRDMTEGQSGPVSRFDLQFLSLLPGLRNIRVLNVDDS